jgi:crotonobetainyl-CoA:carnitine CoA-transferase CaiB-like acyl-CoA transferase
MMLGDYGAEVLKIEDIHAGDPTRFVGTFFENGSAFFRQLNRNKKSIALDLKSVSGREIIKILSKKADVLVEGFRPGVMDRLQLGYNHLKAINPQIVYASISGYGQKGPYRNRAGHDINYTALAGMLELSRGNDGNPVMPTAQIADIAGGSLMALNGIMMALFKRETRGEGSFVDISMTRGLLPWLTYAASALTGNEALPRRDSAHITGGYACYNIYKTKDNRFMSLGALEPAFWQNFCEAVSKPEWISLQFEQEKREELIRQVRSLFKEKSRQEWIELFSETDACCEPILELNEAIKHPVNRAEGCWLESAAGLEGELLTGFPLLFTGKTGSLRLQPPAHGEHTAEILEELGYTKSDIETLRAQGVIKVK